MTLTQRYYLILKLYLYLPVITLVSCKTNNKQTNKQTKSGCSFHLGARTIFEYTVPHSLIWDFSHLFFFFFHDIGVSEECRPEFVAYDQIVFF